jgi:hypothetical protein
MVLYSEEIGFGTGGWHGMAAGDDGPSGFGCGSASLMTRSSMHAEPERYFSSDLLANILSLLPIVVASHCDFKASLSESGQKSSIPQQSVTFPLTYWHIYYPCFPAW